MSIFQNEYINFNQISDVSLLDINSILLENGIELDLNDKFCNDWAGYSYYYCKTLNELDAKQISSFIYIITWFMTNNPIEINPNFKSEDYYKNDRIIVKCLNIYNHLIEEDISDIDLCKKLFNKIYAFYLNIPEEFVKKSERINFVLSYHEMELFERVEGKNRSDKLRNLLNNYFSFE